MNPGVGDRNLPIGAVDPGVGDRNLPIGAVNPGVGDRNLPIGAVNPGVGDRNLPMRKQVIKYKYNMQLYFVRCKFVGVGDEMRFCVKWEWKLILNVGYVSKKKKQLNIYLFIVKKLGLHGFLLKIFYVNIQVIGIYFSMIVTTFSYSKTPQNNLSY